MARLLSAALLLFADRTYARDETLYQSDEYNLGGLGKYVEQTFVSTKVTAPRLNVIKPFTKCDDGSYLFLAPRGEVANSTLVILDHNGSLVWTSGEYEGEAYNLQVQEWRGEKYLTFWAGDNSVRGHGVGLHYMLDQHYNLVRTVQAANNFSADLHSFTVTPQGTILLTVYELVQVDLSHVRISMDVPESHRRPGSTVHTPYYNPNMRDAWVWDSLFQEIDLETGELLFQWRASDHFAWEESYELLLAATREEGWDWFHINSVEKCPDTGHYLISSRHLRTMALVDGSNGTLHWRLGGRKNDFRDLSQRKATSFVGQHDAHFVPGSGGTEITFFDNRADWTIHVEKRSVASRVKLDYGKMTAKLVRQYINEADVYSVSQGSCQTLPNGHVLVGYGNNGVLTEFDENGKVLCDAYFEPSSDWTSGNVQSYRNLKFNWTGIPTTAPNVAERDGALYVSWLGSTQVTQWRIEDSASPVGQFGEVKSVAKEGFETEIQIADLPRRLQQYVQITALDSYNRVLSVSDTLDLGPPPSGITDLEIHLALGEELEANLDNASEAEPTTEQAAAEMLQLREDLQILLAFTVIAFVTSLVLVWCFRGRAWRRVAQEKWREYRGGKRDDDFAGEELSEGRPMRWKRWLGIGGSGGVYRLLGQRDGVEDRGLGARDYVQRSQS